MRQSGEQSDGFSEVLGLRFVEVEDDWHPATLAQFVPQPLQNNDPPFGEAAQQKHALLAYRIDDITDFLIVQKQFDELSYLDVVNRDLGFVPLSNN